MATVVCMLALPWTADVNGFLFSRFGGDVEGRAAVVVRGMIATCWIWALNISIQPVQAGIRALVVDSCPPKQQVQASAYASCITGVGSIFGYSSGFIPLPQVLPWLGNTQFKGLCAIASLALGSTVAVTCSIVDERIYALHGVELRQQSGVVAVFRQILRRLRRMPRMIKRVCTVQFFAWMGWFPFLFYITTYIGDLCKLLNPNRDPLKESLIPSRSSRGSVPPGYHCTLSIPSFSSTILRPVRLLLYGSLRYNSSLNEPPSPTLHFFSAKTASNFQRLSRHSIN